MLFEGLIGFGLVILATVAVTKFALEVAAMPVLTDEEWETIHGTRALTPEEVVEEIKEANRPSDMEMGNLVR